MKILITGGAGYIGSHTCLEFLRRDHILHVVDNLENGDFEALRRVKMLSNESIDFTKCDVRDSASLAEVFHKFQPDAVVHFAGLKSIRESISIPARYYDINVGGTAVLLDCMEKANCRNFVFSSSATIYGEPIYLPCDEGHVLKPINPYGRTKLIGEQLVEDWVGADRGRHGVALRYFNPVGAHISGLIGEQPKGVPSNLMPIVAQVASRTHDYLKIYGNDYETVDGTGVRDYIHVCDLAQAHVAAVEKMSELAPFEAINIGTGRGVSVLEIVREFERQSDKKINFKFVSRRVGDAPAVWADDSKAVRKLQFKAKLGIAEMCRDTWNWTQKNPQGYKCVD